MVSEAQIEMLCDIYKDTCMYGASWISDIVNTLDKESIFESLKTYEFVKTDETKTFVWVTYKGFQVLNY